jgi:hypothetical protein
MGPLPEKLKSRPVFEIPWTVSSTLLLWLFALSLVSFVGSLIAIPWILIRLPHDYFDERYPRTWLRDHHPILRFATHVLKNAAGVIFILGGLAMLVLPGQGLLTIVIGLSLVDFPAKRVLERRLLSRPMVLQAINRLRQRFDRPPLRFENSEKLDPPVIKF